MRLGTFGLEHEVALARRRGFRDGHFLAVHGQADVAVVGHDAVMVPFRGRLRALLGGEAALAVRRHAACDGERGAVHGEDVAVRGVPLVLALHVEAGVEDLDLDAAREGRTGGRQSVGPDEQAGIAAGFHVPPFKLDDEVLIHPLGPLRADRASAGDEHPVAHGEGVRRDVAGHPAGQVLPIEHRDETFFVGGLGGERYKNECENKFLHGHPQSAVKVTNAPENATAKNGADPPIGRAGRIGTRTQLPTKPCSDPSGHRPPPAVLVDNGSQKPLAYRNG